jgi:hypothetical protein
VNIVSDMTIDEMKQMMHCLVVGNLLQTNALNIIEHLPKSASIEEARKIAEECLVELDELADKITDAGLVSKEEMAVAAVLDKLGLLPLA